MECEDRRWLEECRPKEVQEICRLVQERCDQMEYDSSLMYDEYPDRAIIEAMCRRMYGELRPEEELTGMACYRNPLFQLIQVLFLEEMHLRRCRRWRRFW